MIVYSDRFTTFLVASRNHIKSPVTLKPMLAIFSLVKYIHEMNDSYLLTLDCRFQMEFCTWLMKNCVLKS